MMRRARINGRHFLAPGPRFGAALCLAIAAGFAAEAPAQEPAPAYRVVTVAGPAEPGAGSDDGPVAHFKGPWAVAADQAGNLLVADTENHTIRKMAPDGVVTTVAGWAGTAGSADGVGAAARFNLPEGVAVDGAGTVYVADSGNQVIRKIVEGGRVITWAGLPGHIGSTDGTGSAARFFGPQGMALDAVGNLYVADSGNHTVRKIGPGAMVTTVAGVPGLRGAQDGPGASARFHSPSSVAVDRPGNVYVADTDNYTIRKIAPDGMVTTLAGLAGVSGRADGPGRTARFSRPFGVAVDAAGNVYVVSGKKGV